MDDILNDALNAHHAEIRWVLKVARCHFSYHSCLDLSKLFQIMFKDSKIAQDFKMSKTKCMYFLKFGLAPRFREVLSNDIEASLYFSVSFDETQNACKNSAVFFLLKWMCQLGTGVKIATW